MIARRLVIMDGNYEIIRAIDISDIDHANQQMPMHVAIQTMCDMQQWHELQVVVLAPWGKRVITKMDINSAYPQFPDDIR